ncbi:MAG: MarR family transcriptional regulator [Bacteroidetes bacterium]|nr:MarR family transcriptional regulator [Bacteroidota bacterium]MBU1680599.1 MarR family transcriptional regulator [Bacteroidota bacterium]MBU2507636.1 MarR family transcriptional regulator [Bacteroidota bacterium]
MRSNIQYDEETALALSTWVKLARGYSSFNHRASEDVKKFGLSQAQYAILDALGFLGSMKIGELHKKMIFSGGNMTLVLDQLERKGFTKRIFHHEDRRAIIIELTDKGNQAFRKVAVEHAVHIKSLMSALTKEEQKTLGSLLKKLGTTIAR